jgi:hypothetical protein
MRKRASSRSSARSSKSLGIESTLFLRTAAPLAAAFPRSPSRNAAREFGFAALVIMALLPNTGENDDRTMINRCRPHARAASHCFEHDKITHWLFLRIKSRASPRGTGFVSTAKPTARSLIKFRWMTKNERRCFNRLQATFIGSLTRSLSWSSKPGGSFKERHDQRKA